MMGVYFIYILQITKKTERDVIYIEVFSMKVKFFKIKVQISDMKLSCANM